MRTAVITGSSRGIGYAVAQALGLDGFNVVIVGTRESESYRKALEWFEKKNIAHIYVQADISKNEDRKKIITETLQAFSRIDVLINNAGVAPLQRKDLLEMDEESYDRVMNINTKAPMFLTQLAAKEMLRQPAETRSCVIVNITSCSSVVSSVSRGEYCISKAAQSMLTTLYADRLAAEGIPVFEVRPGVIQTDMTSAVKEKYDKLIAEGLFPMPRWGTPEDVASAVSALCSGKFTYSTGNYIDIDGGFHIQRL